MAVKKKKKGMCKCGRPYSMCKCKRKSYGKKS